MKLTLLAALDKNGGIGVEGDLPWYSSEDMAHFKAYTTGPRKVVIMGRKTYDSLPEKNGVKLPGRFKIVLSSKLQETAGDPLFVSSLKELRDFLGSISSITDEAIIIGGASVYEQFINDADNLVLTRFDYEAKGCDKFFPKFNEEDFSFRSRAPLGENAYIMTYKRFQ